MVTKVYKLTLSLQKDIQIKKLMREHLLHIRANMSFPNSVSLHHSPFRPKGHGGKENLTPGHTCVSDFFRGMEVKNNFHKGIQVKDSNLRAKA